MICHHAVRKIVHIKSCWRPWSQQRSAHHPFRRPPPPNPEPYTLNPKPNNAVPTILFGALYHGRRYSPSDFIAISLMMLGMAIFCVTDAATFKHFHPNGIAMVVIAIVADAVSSAVQDKVETDSNPNHFVRFPFLSQPLSLDSQTLKTLNSPPFSRS